LQWTGFPRLWVDTTDLGIIQFVSDYRVKKNVVTQTAPAIERVMQLRPVTYEMADYGNLFVADEVQREGFIAHEVQAIVPQAVNGEKDAVNPDGSMNIQGIDHSMLVPILTAAIKELVARVEALEAKA
jgi:hypothetical protein